MMDVYNGNATTDGNGFATVKLPAWFQALNRDFRYQVTIVGTRGWNARVVKKIADNRFTIQTDQPNLSVSWLVTGIRHDRRANAHRIKVVVRRAGPTKASTSRRTSMASRARRRPTGPGRGEGERRARRVRPSARQVECEGAGEVEVETIPVVK